jgi:hypothetical protein
VYNDFRLDLWFSKTFDVTSSLRSGQLKNSFIIHITPDRFVHPIDGPHLRVGEPDFSSNRQSTLFHTHLMDQTGYGIGLFIVEFPEPGGQRLNLKAFVLRSFYLFGDTTKIKFLRSSHKKVLAGLKQEKP